MRPKWESNVKTIIPNRFTARPVQPNQLAQRKPKFVHGQSFYSIASRDVKFYYSVEISFVIRCFKFEYLKKRIFKKTDRGVNQNRKQYCMLLVAKQSI